MASVPQPFLFLFSEFGFKAFSWNGCIIFSFTENSPFDIGDKTPAVDKEDEQNDGEGEEEAAEVMEELQTDHPEEESAQDPKDEEEENADDKDNNLLENNEEADKEEEAAIGDLSVPVDEEQKPKVRNSQMVRIHIYT